MVYIVQKFLRGICMVTCIHIQNYFNQRITYTYNNSTTKTIIIQILFTNNGSWPELTIWGGTGSFWFILFGYLKISHFFHLCELCYHIWLITKNTMGQNNIKLYLGRNQLLLINITMHCIQENRLTRGLPFTFRVKRT